MTAARIIDYVAEDFVKKHSIDLRQNELALKRLTEAAQKAELELSMKDATDINLPFIAADKKGPLHIKLRVTRDNLGGW